MFLMLKKGYHYIFAPLIVLILLGAFYSVFGIFPFGKNTVSWCDMSQQTVPLLMNLKDILDGKSDLFYSTGNAGGMNFFGIFLFFLSSPLYLTVEFVEKSHIIYLVNILLAIKLALASLSASVYFNKIHKKLKNEFCVVLSVMYALCGYGIMYCQTLVWLDIMILFPLLVMSLERMLKQKKPAMYGIVLSTMMIISFYISFMLIIYLLIAVPLFISIRCRRNKRKKAAFIFLRTSLISALITCPIWLCAYLQISKSARGGSTLLQLMYLPMFENTGNKFCVIMCTALCIAVLPFFIKNKICRIKKVKYNLILLLLLMIPVFIDPINKMWHTGNYQSFPLRYGFIIIFTMLILAAYYFESISESERNSHGFILSIMLIAAGFIAVCIYTVYSKRDVLSSYIKTLKVDSKAFKMLFGIFIFAFMIYIICIYLHRKKFITSKILCLMLGIVFVGEALTSFSVNIGYAASDGDVLKDSAQLEYDKTDEPYYRTKTEKKYLHVNMIGGLGYNSLAHYTSLTSEDYMFAMKKLGYSSYWMEVGSNGGTALTDALLAIKYSIGTYFDLKSYYDITFLDGDLERGESSICCPVGIKSDLSPKNMGSLNDSSRVETQKSLAENFFGKSNMIYEYKSNFTAGGSLKYENAKYQISLSDKNSGMFQMRYSIDVKDKQLLYFDIFDVLSNNISESYFGAAEIYVNGNNVTSDYPSQKNNGIFTLGEFENTTVEVLVLFKKDISVKSLGVFGIDIDKLKECTEKTKGCDFYINGNKMTAECICENEEFLYMSVPYEKGLSAYVNGEKTEIYKVNDAFCAIKLEKGKNSIKLSFVPEGMNIALIISALGFLILIFSSKIKLREKMLKCCECLSLAAVRLLFGLVILIIYFLPVLVRLVVVFLNLIN